MFKSALIDDSKKKINNKIILLLKQSTDFKRLHLILIK